VFGVCVCVSMALRKKKDMCFRCHALSRERDFDASSRVRGACGEAGERVTKVFDDDSKAYLSEAHSCALLINPLPVLLLKYSYHKSYFLKLSPLQRRSKHI